MKRSKSTIRKRKFLPILAVSILALLGISATFSFYSDSFSFANLFNLNHYEAQYVETFESPDNWKTCEEVPKTVITTNNSTAPFKVRLSYEEYWRNKEDNANLPLQKDGETLAIINFQNEDDWTLEGNWYYYKQDLQPGESTTSLFKSVTLNCQSNLAANNVCRETENGTVCETPEDDYENAKYHLNITVQTSSEEFSHDNEYYTLTVNPNGGTYKGSSDVYSERILWGTTVDLGSIAYADHELINWTKNENETHTGTTIRITSDTTLKANWQSSLFHNVTVNPNGGTLADKTEPIITSVRQGTNYTLTNELPTREGYLFDGWFVSDDTELTDHTFTVMGDVTITAHWSIAVAKNERTGERYRSITAAEADAQNGDTITLLVDTNEHFTNTKTITLDLGTHTVTGSITNNGNLTLINGEINNPDGIAVTNNSVFTMGINDFKDDNTVRILPNYVRVIGTTTGLKQNGEFYFYDGFIEGDVGLEGGYNGAPYYRNTFDNTIVYYFPLVDHNWEKDCQHVELAGSDNAVTKTKIGGDIYYYNLQDNINTSIRTGYKIYAVRNFDASYAITSAEGTDVVFDICGYNITINDTITINGKFTIEDSETTVSTVSVEDNSIAMPNVNGNVFVTPHDDNTTTTITYGGLISVPQTIMNHGNFVINNARITGTTANDTIKNYATLTMNGGALGATTGYTMQPIADAVYAMDKNSYLYSTSTNNPTVYSSLSNFKWTSAGNIYGKKTGIQINSGKATIDNGVIYGASYGTSGTVIINGGTIKSSATGASGNTTMNSGKIIASGTGTVTGVYGTLTLNNGEIIATNTARNGNTVYGINASYATINTYGGSVTTTGGTGTTYGIYSYGSSTKSNVYIHGGSLKSTATSGTCYGIYTADNDSRNLSVSGGLVECQSESGTSYGIYGKGYSHNATGGKIVGGTYGVYIANANIFTIGTNDDELSTTNPEIIGGKYALYGSDNSSIYFYDGVLRGGTEAYKDGLIKAIANDTAIRVETTSIDGFDYDTRYLSEEYDVAKIGNTKYTKLIDAINASSAGDIIELIAENYIFSSFIISEDKNFTIETNGYGIHTGNPIINNGKVKIINSSTEQNLVFSYHNAGYFITNNAGAALILENLSFNTNYGIENKGLLQMKNTTIIASNTAIKNSGELTASNSTKLTATSYPFYNNGTASLTDATLSNGTIYNESGQLTISDSVASRTGESILEFIVNKGTLETSAFKATLTNTNFSSSGTKYARTIYNSGNLISTNNTEFKHVVGKPNIYFYQYSTAIYNDGGTVNASNTNFITDSSAVSYNSYGVYAIYNPAGTFALTSGSAISNGKYSTYGIWNNSGTVTIGVPEPQTSQNYGRDTADVSLTNPDIKAIGTNTGIGVKNNTGKIYYYDGRITGSTAAMPEKPAGVEYLYEPKDYVDEETGYHYRVLEWMREQANE